MTHIRHILLPMALLLTLAACGDDGGGATATPEPDAGADTSTGDDGGLADADEQPDGADDANATPDAPSDPIEALLAPGAFNVGYASMDVTYRPEGYEEDRTLRVVFWYPTEETDGAEPQYGGLLPRPGVIDGASVALSEPAPLMVFSHGNGGFAEQSYFLTEYMATHGWIVVAFDHTGNTAFDQGDATPFFDLRPQDVHAVLDAVDALPAAHALSGLIGEDVAMAGHSFGGYTTLAVAGAGYDVDTLLAVCDGQQNAYCDLVASAEDRWRAGFGDDRIDVAVPMTPAGALVFGGGLADIEVPVLLMTAARDATLPEGQEGDPIWAGLDGADDLRIVLEEGGHYTYSNACDLLPTIGQNDGCGADFTPPAEAHVAINAYVHAYLRKHLFGDDRYDALLTGGRELRGDVTVVGQ